MSGDNRASGFTMTVLGSSGSYASSTNPCTGYLLVSPGATVLLDCGPGTLGPLQAATDINDLSAVVLTHCHPDHWLELPVLRNVLIWFEPRESLPVYGTAQTRSMDQAITVMAPGRHDPVDWTTINPSSTLEIGDQKWRFCLTDHSVETLAVRVDAGGRSFVFTSDTGPGWSCSEFGDGIDLVLSDASHLASRENQGIPHMSAREAAERALEAGAGRLVLTHLVPGSDVDAHRAEAEAAYGGPVDVALPGMTFDI